MVGRPPSRQKAPAEAHKVLLRSTQNTSIDELPIERSGVISGKMDLDNNLPINLPMTAAVHTSKTVSRTPKLHNSTWRYHKYYTVCGNIS